MVLSSGFYVTYYRFTWDFQPFGHWGLVSLNPSTGTFSFPGQGQGEIHTRRSSAWVISTRPRRALRRLVCAEWNHPGTPVVPWRLWRTPGPGSRLGSRDQPVAWEYSLGFAKRGWQGWEAEVEGGKRKTPELNRILRWSMQRKMCTVESWWITFLPMKRFCNPKGVGYVINPRFYIVDWLMGLDSVWMT